MTDLASRPAALHPRCDGRRVLFELLDEDRRFACAISIGALEDMSERRCFRAVDQLSAFAGAREQIEAIALHKIRSHAHDVSSLLNIWSSDVEDALTLSETVAGSSA